MNNYNSVVYELSYEDYDAHPGIRITNLRTLARSPRHFEARAFEDTTEDSAALELGRLFHEAILPHSKVLEGLIARPEGLNLNTAEGREWKRAATENGKRPVPQETYELLERARQRIYEADLKALLEGADYEVSLFWSVGIGTQATPIRCKARVDAVPQTPLGKYSLVDFKTVTNGEPKAAWYAALQYGWFLQAAWYLWGWNVLNPEDQRSGFTWVLFEKQPPYAVYVYSASQQALERARDEIAQLLARLEQCMTEYGKETWPDQASIALKQGSIPILDPPHEKALVALR